jgi:hypothetical protein
MHFRSGRLTDDQDASGRGGTHDRTRLMGKRCAARLRPADPASADLGEQLVESLRHGS